jgi:hypothetical protein
VRHDDGRPVDAHPAQRVLDVPLGLRVQRAGRFVQQDYRRRLQQRPRYRHPLLFAAAQSQPSLAHLGVVGVGEREDLVVDVGSARRLDHVGVRRREATVLDVVADGVVEEDGVLGDHPYGPTQRLLGDGFDVLPVDDDRARLDVVEPEQQPNYGALAAPGRTNLRNKRSKPTFRFGLSDSPHQSHSLPWGHRERDVLQHQSLGQVPEGHVVKLHRAPLHRDRPRVGSVDDVLVLSQQVEHVLHVDEVLLDRPVVSAEPVQRNVQLDYVRGEEDVLAHSEFVLDHQVGAEEAAAQETRADDHVLHRVQDV